MILGNMQDGVIDAINRAHEARHAGDWKDRPYLEMSSIGHECGRWIWLRYRHALDEHIDGRLYRLFRRGQREEETIVEDLRMAGVSIDHTGDGQMEVAYGPAKGHIDGRITAGVPEAPKEEMLAEFKSYNASRFKTLCDKGVRESDPKYYTQMQCYMHCSKVPRCLFVAVCKDDDRMHVERVKLDDGYACRMLDRGVGYALDTHIPGPLSADPTFYKCRMCSFSPFCHSKEKMPDHICCRTCAFSIAMPDGRWKCVNPAVDDVIPEGRDLEEYPCHAIHPDLVSWEVDHLRTDGRNICWVIDGQRVLNGAAGYSSSHIIASVRAARATQGRIIWS